MSSGGCCGGDSSAPKIKKKGRFAEILLDEQLYLAFEDYLRGEFSDENLHFYKDTFPFEATQETTKPSTELKAAARLLSNKYLGSVHRPSLSSSILSSKFSVIIEQVFALCGPEPTFFCSFLFKVGHGTSSAQYSSPDGR
jgi:hypothetical protein